MKKTTLFAIRKTGQYMMLAGSLLFGTGLVTSLAAGGAMRIADNNDPAIVAERAKLKIEEEKAYNLRKAEHAAEAEAYAKEKVEKGLDKAEQTISKKSQEIKDLKKKIEELEEAASKPSFSVAINTQD